MTAGQRTDWRRATVDVIKIIRRRLFEKGNNRCLQGDSGINVKLKRGLRGIWAGYTEFEGEGGVEEESAVLRCTNRQGQVSLTDVWDTARKTDARDKDRVVFKRLFENLSQTFKSTFGYGSRVQMRHRDTNAFVRFQQILINCGCELE